MSAPRTLDGLLGTEKLPRPVILRLLRALLGQAGVGLHPSRILLYTDGRISVEGGAPVPGYRAPESTGTASPTEDVYVIGTIFYELLAGKKLGQLPEREVLHGPALDRAIDDLPDLSTEDRMLLKAMLAFRPASRAEPRLLLSELASMDAEAPAPPSSPAPSGNGRWIALVGCVLVLSLSCVLTTVLLAWLASSFGGPIGASLTN